MTGKELDSLLENRKVPAPPPVSAIEAEEFSRRFFAGLEQRRRLRRWRWSLGSAAALLLLTVSGVLLRPGSFREPGTGDSRMLFAEARRLFGDRVGVAVLGDEVITFERSAAEQPRSRFLLTWRDRATGRSAELVFSGGEGESIRLDSAVLSGSILITRSDARTLVLELDLQGQDGRRLRGFALAPGGPEGDFRLTQVLEG